MLGLSVATAAAVADPTDESSPPSSETTETTPTTETSVPTDTSESTEPSTPPPPSSSSSSSPEQAPEEQPAEDEEPADKPAIQSYRDVQMTAVFGKASYNTGEKMSITVTVKNTGTDDADIRVDFIPVGQDAVAVDYPSPFDGGNVFTLPAGASRTHKIAGATGNPAVSTAKLYGWVIAPTGESQQFVFTVPIKQTTGHASGTVYTDRNDNGRFDAGEGQSGVTLTWTSSYQNGVTRTATTNAAGEFGLDLPTGPYGVYGAGPDGLQVGFRQITVNPSGVDDLL